MTFRELLNLHILKLKICNINSRIIYIPIDYADESKNFIDTNLFGMVCFLGEIGIYKDYHICAKAGYFNPTASIYSLDNNLSIIKTSFDEYDIKK